MKNRIALRLTLYFTAVLLSFALIISGVFYQFFKQHTVDIKKNAMRVQAQKISEVISDNMSRLEKRYGDGIASSRFINYIDNVTQDLVWVVDREHNLSVSKENMQRMRRRYAERHPHKNLPPAPSTPHEAYTALPQHIKEKVEACFAGEKFIVQEYAPMLDSIMITVGEPVYDENKNIKAVVLLHAPVQGLHDAIWACLRILFFSVLAALIFGVVLSIILSRHFTRPLNIMKENALRLAERDYTARNNLTQKDDIAALGKTLDLLAERLKLADEESQKLEKLRRNFIANISHELRTPVTVIRGSLEALRDGVVTETNEVQEFHEQMYNESIFLQRLINDLLDLSRLQNTDFPIEKERLNFCDAVQDAVRSSRRLGIEKNLHIDYTADTEIYPLLGDYDRLRQMLLIFLHNSIKFSQADSSVELNLNKNILTVRDHGCGMNPEDIPHAFERFYKAHNEQNKTGSGLGLAIAQQIALRHNMQLTLESEINRGTTITLTLPPRMEVEENGEI